MALWHRAAKRELPDWMSVPWPWWQGLVALPAWIAVQVAIGTLLSLLSFYLPWISKFVDQIRSGQQLQAQVAAYMLEVLAGVIVIGWYLWKYRANLGVVGWRKFDVGKTIAYFVGFFVIFLVGVQIVLTLVSLLVPGFNENQAQTNGIVSTAHQQPLLAILAVVVLAPMLEETLFRGFIFPALSKKMGLIWGAIVSSALFGIAHLQANVSIYTFVLALVLCYLYVKLRSTVPGMFLHMLNNYIAFMAMLHK